ncbi:MAG TPA: cytochrome c oxidase assembly protein [Opitutaceae bacterium]|nr:cytochrome c oxidase assembly protein [Opitutaceae bacterium]
MIDWRHWHNEPYLVGGLVFLGWLWAIAAGPLRAKLLRRAGVSPAEAETAPFPRAQAWQFYAALVTFYLAVGSPLDQIGERFLFSAHMLQHQLLIYPAAVLFLRGLPWWMVDAVLDRPALRGPVRLLTSLLGCGLIYTVVIGGWHAPFLYEWALQNKVVHVAEHVMFFGAGLFYWWPLLSPSRAFPRVSYAAQMVFLFAVLIGMTPVFAYITFSDDILYPTYEYAPRLIADFSPANDQLLAGVSMKLMGLSVALLAFGVSFYRWARTTHHVDAR